MNRYRVCYVTISKNGLWVEKGEKYIDAENLNQIIMELGKSVKTKFYLLEVWERVDVGTYSLVSRSEMNENQIYNRSLKSYIEEIEKTIGPEESFYLDKTYARKLRTILKEIVEKFCSERMV